MAYAQFGHCLQNILCVRRTGIDDIGRNHRHVQAMAANCRNQRRQILAYSRRIHVSTVTNSDIDSVKADIGRGLSQFLALEKLQCLEKIATFSLELQSPRCR